MSGRRAQAKFAGARGGGLTVRRFVFSLAALGAFLALAACARSQLRPPCAQGAICLLYGNGAEPVSLDPAKIDGTWENVIVSQLIVGLTQADAAGNPIPGVATRWETSPDGLTWTFHLRNALWSDGVPVTADDFVYGMRREVDPKTASYSAFLLFFVKNAEKVVDGKAPTSALGVEAPDPHTLVIHLEYPWPLLLRYATGRVMWPVPKHVVERLGDKWARPGAYVGDGPYSLVSWKLGDKVVIRRNPRYWDAAHVCYNEIDFYPTTDAIAAERRVRAGQLDVSTTVQSNRLDFLRRTGMASYLRIAPLGAVTYLAFNLRDPALKDVRVRQALSMAIDRDFIAYKLLRGGQTPAYSFVPPGLPGWSGGPQTYWAGWPLARRQAEARRLLAAAGYGPGHPLTLTIKQRDSSDPLLFMPSVQEDWKQVGVHVSLMVEDVQVAYQDYELHDFQVADAGWQAPDPLDYFELLKSDTGGQNYGRYDNPAYDAAYEAALHSRDLATREAHMRQAEQILLADAPVAPIYFPASRNLVNPQITGWVNNHGDIHGAQWLCRPPTRSAIAVATTQ